MKNTKAAGIRGASLPECPPPEVVKVCYAGNTLCQSANRWQLRQDVMHDISMHVGQTEIASLMAEGHPFVIDA